MITDADRHAAADALQAARPILADEVRAGRMDDYPGVQAFAAHRLLGQREMQEKAAAYLDGYAGGHYMAQSCAQAIRAIEVG